MTATTFSANYNIKQSSQSRMAHWSPICYIIGAQSHWCPITAVQFELFVTGYLLLDTHVICTSIMCAIVFSKLMESTTMLKRSSQKTFLITTFVIRYNLLVIGHNVIQCRD